MRLPGPPPVVEPKMYGPDVQLTDKPDMFTLDDEAGGQRAEMPCGHAISMFYRIYFVQVLKIISEIRFPLSWANDHEILSTVICTVPPLWYSA
jgi:hypothetical protein